MNILCKQPQFPGQCCVCFINVERGKTVSLNCRCLIAFCQSCAKSQLSMRNGTFRLSDTTDQYLTCPICKQNTSQNACGVRKASEQAADRQEHLLISSACIHYKVHQPARRAKSDKYKLLIQSFHQDGFDCSHLIAENDSSKVRLKLSILEIERISQSTSVSVQSSLLLSPMDLILFASDITMENVAESVRNNQPCDIDMTCILCYDFIGPNQSVQLTCRCKNLNVCQICARGMICNQRSTYNEGCLICPVCRTESSDVVGSVSVVNQSESELVDMAAATTEDRPPTTLANAKPRACRKRKRTDVELLGLIASFNTAGRGFLTGSFCLEDRINQQGNTSSAPTTEMLTLDVAKLQLRRNSVRNCDGDPGLGDPGHLKGLSIRKNKWMEALLSSSEVGERLEKYGPSSSLAGLINLCNNSAVYRRCKFEVMNLRSRTVPFCWRLCHEDHSDGGGDGICGELHWTGSLVV